MSFPPPMSCLVDEPITLVFHDGTRVASAIRIGFPAQAHQPGDLSADFESHCALHIAGLYEAGPPIGGSRLQALNSALELLGMLAHMFISHEGARILDASGEDAALPVLLGPYFAPVRETP